MTMRRTLALLLTCCALGALPAAADFDVDVTAPPGFADGLTRVVVLAVECHESVDCGQVEDRIAEELGNVKAPFEVVEPKKVREELFALGHADYDEAVRAALLEKLGVDGVLELRVPFANRGDGPGGRRRSEVQLSLRLVTVDGALRLNARGSGRPLNVVSGTERVAGTVVEHILAEAFPRR
jgi:hypothetical protein